MVAHSAHSFVAAPRVQLFVNTRLVLPYYLAIKEQQVEHPRVALPATPETSPSKPLDHKP